MDGQQIQFDLNKICVLLEAEDKEKRKNGLNNINRILNNDELRDFEGIWNVLHRPLMKLLSDPAEICRDRCLEIIKIFMNDLPMKDRNIVYVIPILSKRLGSQELIEPSEEVRLTAVKLLRQIISKYKEELSVYMEDIIQILSKTVKDNYSEVKRESCLCISELGKNIPRHFYTCSENLVEPILNNFTHQHYKVRSCSVRTIGDVLQYGNSKIMEKVATPMAERLFDQNAVVRLAVIEVTGRWLVELRDRYSWWYKLIPLIMTGLHDEIEDIRIKAAEMWDAAGRLYIEENQHDDKFKDKLDFLTEGPKHYPIYISRPNLGCRVITQQNMGKLVQAIGNELGDWMFDIRVRSAQLLCVLVLNVEEEVTQHIEKLLPPMYRAANDRDQRVVESIEKAAEYLGYFVPADVYCDLILPTMEECLSPGHLRIFAAILKGSEKTSVVSQLDEIGEFLQQDCILNNRKSSYQRQILNCCNSLILVSEQDIVSITKHLFDAIFITLSMSTEEDVQREAHRLLNELRKFNDLTNTEELHKIHLRSLLIRIGDKENIWSIYTMEALIFRACLIHAGIALAMNMDLALPMLQESTNDKADPELRVKHFILLSDYFFRDEKTFHYIQDLQSFVNSIFEELIIPSLVWSVGKVAESIRTAALFCLCTMLENNIVPKCIEIFPDDQGFLSLFDKIVPILITSVDDNAKKARLYSLKAICLIMNISHCLSCTTEDHVNRIYPAILKRLDDGCNDVRATSVEALVQIWDAMPKDYDLIFNRGHIDALYAMTIVHLDDPESDFRSLMLNAMLKLANIHPELLAERLQNCKSNFQNQDGIQQLLEYCHNKLSNAKS